MILLSNTDCVVLCHMVDMIILWTWLICIRHKRHFALSIRVKTLDIMPYNHTVYYIITLNRFTQKQI